MIENHDFESVSDLMDFIAPWNNPANLQGFIFRGHSQEHYELIPSALRADNIDWFWQIYGGRPINQQHEWESWQIHAEYTILRNFYKLADQRGLEVPISSAVRAHLASDFDFHRDITLHGKEIWIPEDLLETVALAQHYGIPTRLLDWSYDINIALYFAFHGALEKSGKLVLWALNKEYLSFLKPTDGSINVNFVTPHYAGNPNLNAQKGLFTHWPTTRQSKFEEMNHILAGGEEIRLVDRRPLDELIKSELKSEDEKFKIFKRFTLPCSEATKGCQIMDHLGYDTARVFPGYDGVAKYLLNRHQY